MAFPLESLAMSRIYPALVVVLALLSATGCSSDQKRPNVLVVVVDTLREDRLGCYGADRDTSPAIDKLAATGALFENAYAPSPWTKPSVASILTGKFPSGHGLTGLDAKLPSGARSIAQRLKAAGYSTAGVVSNKLIGGFSKGFDTFDKSEAKGPNHVSARGVTTKAIALMNELGARENPFFLYVHYFDPHVDYKPHAELGFTPNSVGRLDGTQSWNELDELGPDLTPEEIEYVRDLYDGEVRYTDDFVGELLAELDALAISENTVVVFTADHGEEIFEHGNIGHTRTLYEELIRVPYLIRAPGVKPGLRLESPVSIVSLVPTVMDLVGLSPDAKDFQSSSLSNQLLKGEQPKITPMIFAEVDFIPPKKGNVPVGLTRMKSLRQGRYKIIADQLNDTVALFDLEQDPDEMNDLSSEDPERLQKMAELLALAIEHSKRDALTAETEELTEEEIEALRALGYVE